MGRLRIDDDTVRHLSTFQRLGEHLEIQPPGEMLPIGARTVFQALRTQAASQVGSGWVWPWWLHRQIDPRSVAFVPSGHLPFLSNVTGRNWTSIGNVGSAREAVVDPRGLVSPWIDGWSLDWWVGAEDTWHVPSESANVRQSLVDDTPVVETRMRVPGGDIVHRSYAMRETAADGGRDLAIVEIENASAVPVALALAVRPYDVEGLSVIERIELHGETVTVDGRVAMLLPREPNQVAASTFRDGDSAATVFAGEAVDEFPRGLRCEAGMAQAAFVYPLPHSATIRVALPIEPEPRTRRTGRVRRRLQRAAGYPSALPPAEQVAKGWTAQSDRGMRLVLPDERLQSAVDANRRYLLLFHDGDVITPGTRTYHRFWFRDAAYLLAALDRYGFHSESAQVLASYPGRQRNDGFLFSQRLEWDANGAALWSLAHHWDLTRNDELVNACVPMVAGAVEWIERKRRGKRPDAALHGLMPAGISAEHLGPHDYFYWDDFWSLAGLRDGARLLAAAGEDDAAARATACLDSMRSDVRASMAATAERLGTRAVPAGPTRRIDPGVIGSLVAAWPLDLLGADDPTMVETLEVIRDRFCLDEAFFQGISHTGLGTYLTLQVAGVELVAGDRRALDRLDWLLSAATSTWTWPEAIHPRVAGGCMGDGHHGWTAAEFLSFVRSMLVRETDAGLALCSMIPERWYGQGIEVHGAPTRFGTLSFAVRWHGARPALLWELDRHDAERPVAITCPGLDPSWRSTDDRGETLLAEPSAPTASVGAPPGEWFA
ncbi:MAG: hypothetical protein U5K30_12335 [Acidimicrobiales bacterium]|nr:hypothetical protein [Acidimicrobiales bacterium]